MEKGVMGGEKGEEEKREQREVYPFCSSSYIGNMINTKNAKLIS